MKTIKVLFSICLLGLISSGCDQLLEEAPQSQIVPSYFNSAAGVLGGIAGVYNDIRGPWGNEGLASEINGGTDEYLMGGSAGTTIVYTYSGMNGLNGPANLWDIGFRDINTINGVIKYGQSIDLPDATRKQYLAQAKFLRAFWYFHLVQSFGAIPLNTEFITVPSQEAHPSPVADVYAQIITDFTEAAADLPNIPTAPFLGKAATKPVAQFLLAKAYLTRGWLNNTASDFTQAAALCDAIIAAKTTYGLDLWADYADVFVPANDYGKETMFVADHQMDAKYGYYVVGGANGGGAAQNLQPWFANWNYPANAGINSSGSPTSGFVNSGTQTMNRDAFYGRPYIRHRPNTDPMTTGPNAGKNYFLDQAFTNRTNDSRFANTFYTVYIANKATTNTATTAGNTRGTSYTLNVGDTAVWFPDFDVANAPQRVGTRVFKGLVVPPRLWNANMFPAVKKHMDPSRGANFNDPSTRPQVLYRFADVYLIGAEAHFKAGNTAQAVTLLNVIRARAAYRPSRPGMTAAQNTAANAAAVTAMTATTAADLAAGGINFILDERTRELFNEWHRWWDLVRTRTLVTRVRAWNKEAAPFIQDFHMLRPIPQVNQIDRVKNPDGPYPQNPGY